VFNLKEKTMNATTKATIAQATVKAAAAPKAVKAKAEKVAQVIVAKAAETAKAKVAAKPKAPAKVKAEAPAKVEKVVKAKPAVKAEVTKKVSKKAQALEIILKNPEAGRQKILAMFQSKLSMSAAQANTYYYLVKA
jgi:hypothetical protein